MRRMFESPKGNESKMPSTCTARRNIEENNYFPYNSVHTTHFHNLLSQKKFTRHFCDLSKNCLLLSGSVWKDFNRARKIFHNFDMYSE